LRISKKSKTQPEPGPQPEKARKRKLPGLFFITLAPLPDNMLNI